MVVLIVILAVGLGVGLIGAIATISRDSKERGKEWKRTCRRCATVWYVSPQAARAVVDPVELTAAKMYRAGKRSSFLTTRASAAELRVQNLEDKAARARVTNSCPQCGSGSFDAEMVDA